MTWTSYEPSGSCITRSAVPGYLAVAAALAFAAAVPVTGVPKPPWAPAGGPVSVPVTVNSLETLTCTSPPDFCVTWTRYEPSESCSTRSTVPGYLAVAAALALSAAAPVTVFPMPGGTPSGLDEVAAAGVADAVLGVLLEAPQPARRPATATAATAPASVLRRRGKILGWVDDMPLRIGARCASRLGDSRVNAQSGRRRAAPAPRANAAPADSRIEEGAGRQRRSPWSLGVGGDLLVSAVLTCAAPGGTTHHGGRHDARPSSPRCGCPRGAARTGAPERDANQGSDPVPREARRREHAPVARDAHRVVPCERRGPRRPVGAHRERGGRVRVGRREVRADDRDREQPARRPAGVRVEDVRAALVLARRRDREVLDGENGGELVERLGVADADAPEAIRRRAAAGDDVPAGVDAEPRRARRHEPLGGAGDRPPLDVAGRVEAAGGPGGEEAVGLALEREAAGEHLVDLWRALADRDLAAGEAADLAVVAVGAERRVDPAQPVEGDVDIHVVSVGEVDA